MGLEEFTWWGYFASRTRILFTRTGHAFETAIRIIICSCVVVIVIAWVHFKVKLFPVEVFGTMSGLLTTIVVIILGAMVIGFFGTLFICSFSVKGRRWFDKALKISESADFEQFRTHQQFNSRVTERLDKIETALDGLKKEIRLLRKTQDSDSAKTT